MAMKSRAIQISTGVIAIIAIVAVIVGFTGGSANSRTGKAGQVLTVSKVSGIASGEKISVTGKGFDTSVGIYVELCAIVPADQLPNPCGGGANKSGASAASYWISSNPPSYGRGLAIAYGSGGSFSVALQVSPMIGTLDCRRSACAVYVRADHLRTQDRSHDLYVPVHFSTN